MQDGACADWNTEAFFEAAEVSEVMRCLEAGADLEARNDSGFTPLHQAAFICNTEAIEALMQAGADLEARKEEGETRLHTASVVAWIGAEMEFPLSPSGSVRRYVRTQAVRVRSLCSGLSGRPGSP